MTDLDTLGGRTYSFAGGINDAGQVVGYSYTNVTGDEHPAFITGPDGIGMSNLNSLADLPGGIYLTDATGINNLRQVIATATITIVPEPASYALILAGLGLVRFMVRRKKLPDNIVVRG